MGKNDFNQELWDKINSINLHRVWQSLIVRKGYTAERADEAINGYRKYLYLAAQYGKISPTSDIDEVWHTHILFLSSYIRDCMTIFGRIIYHVPNQISEEQVSVALQGKTFVKNSIEPKMAECEGTCGDDPADCEVVVQCSGDDNRTKVMYFNTFVPIDEYAENDRFNLSFTKFKTMEEEIFA